MGGGQVSFTETTYETRVRRALIQARSWGPPATEPGKSKATAQMASLLAPGPAGSCDSGSPDTFPAPPPQGSG